MKVAVIDEQINTSVPMLTGAHVSVREPSFCVVPDNPSQFYPAQTTQVSASSLHGTNVTALISGTGAGYDGGAATAGIAPDAQVRFYAIRGNSDTERCGHVSDSDTSSEFARAIVAAVDDGAQIISYSIGQFLNGSEEDAIAWALHRGVILVGALPNKSEQLDTSAQVNGVVAVAAVDENLQPPNEDAAHGPTPYPRVTVRAAGVGMFYQGTVESGSWQTTKTDAAGTSLATPLVAGMLADVWSKYPKATGNQILQSLIHNTGGQDHALGYDAVLGYGLASVVHMLKVDPTQYPDVNPLIDVRADRQWIITAEQIAQAQRPAWAPALATPSPSASVAPAVPSSSGGLGAWVWVIGGGVALLLVVVLVVVLATRRRPDPQAPAGTHRQA
ncbi:S8 family serine peptidase [Cellulomonas citrea]|uniref:S8 family serine peptidase n=1 Tax=Cellulomonas citrea TaxID=1909423 RepID=UPI001359CE37|nr:S8 family serine peptidase [Cellulomonas citrea]